MTSQEKLKMQYLSNPCGTLATAFWKEGFFQKPDGIEISLNSGEGTPYFRLIHHLKNDINVILPAGFIFRNVNMPSEAKLVSDIINACYEGYAQTADSIIQWMKYPVYDSNLWVFIYDEADDLPIALGIADLDMTIKEGSLEWIQVLPNYQGKGLGQAIVHELLARLKSCADFVTVSGEVDNVTNPEKLYRKCGFIGDDIWFVNQRTDK